MRITKERLDEIFEIIEFHHLIFSIKYVDSTFLTSLDRALLRKFGVDVRFIKKEDLITDMYKFGMLADALGYVESKNISYDYFKTFIKEGRMIPLTAAEKYAIDIIKTQAFNDVKNLGARIKNEISEIVGQDAISRRNEYIKIGRELAVSAVERRKTAKWLRSELGHRTGDWTRDLDRVADFVLHSAFDNGKAASIEKNHGKDAQVFKHVFSDACDHCVKAYLTNGFGSQPIIFKLSELIANGTNVGRKTAEWKPVIGPHHPFCRCELDFVEVGYVWDEDKKMFTPGIFVNKFNRQSRAKITITN